MDFMDFSRRLYRWASEGVDMYVDDKTALVTKHISFLHSGYSRLLFGK